jgi:signal transduction histidine kinase
MVNSESIERVLKNLISNAIKYSHKNSRIKIRAEIDRSGDYLQISIEDSGIGIPEEHLNRIFDRFYRIETKVHSVKGTGLGLHLVKIAIEKHHNGKVFVESKLNEGSTFGFKIPLKVLEIEEQSSAPSKKEKVN